LLGSFALDDKNDRGWTYHGLYVGIQLCNNIGAPRSVRRQLSGGHAVDARHTGRELQMAVSSTVYARMGEAASEPLPLGEWIERLSLPALTEIEVDITFYDEISLRSPVSAVVRGLLGERLRARTCLTGATTCSGCGVWRSCDYARIFGADTGSRAADGGLGDLHSFWLQGLPAARHLDPGSRYTARLLTTDVHDHRLHTLHEAFRDALAVLGQGPRRRAHLSRLSASRARRRAIEPCVTASQMWWVETLTPLLIAPARQDAHLPKCPQVPWLPVLLGAAVRRLRALTQRFSADDPAAPVILPDLGDLEVVAGSVAAWQGAVISQRQRRGYPLEHGLTGGVLLRGKAMPEIGSLLQLLQHTGVGKKTTMGFGSLRVEAVGR